MKPENKSTLSPFLQGKEARWDGKAEEESPFKEGSADDQQWLMGYFEARDAETEGDE